MKGAIPFNIHTPLMDEVHENLIPKKKKIKVLTHNPQKKSQVFYSPLEQRAILCCTIKKKWEDQRMPPDLSEMTSLPAILAPQIAKFQQPKI